ncbi:uncharacterized protein BCR38DRAFT_11301 [Pseudomassariella vexata]|uniref:Glucose-methanol-choline oxidoreductase N-terminal domain-containing protein n=1 Tax=Pseudomassariella vexata TaxID=1141098 RepID=A0A1Y2EIY0_9PEZI|nr:uncharacterized protein BCR38DRAFT_11301 [Pseudomassariella vexata]ORY71500.1 hypothetical protein BCR38DRAFT_11301 [Pseudomassariella vexata]
MPVTYDFLIVGSGPAGSAVAAGLANSAKKPKVLLLEAGGDNEDRNCRVDSQRWFTLRNQDMNWRYKTVPQEHCLNREIDYPRGRGVGGSSAINFSIYNIGAHDDYEEWARFVGDDTFQWKKMHQRFKDLETFHGGLPEGVDKKYAAPKLSDHGTSGPIHVGYAAEWEDDVLPLLDLFQEAGFPLNPDHNSGDPLGMSVLINSAHRGIRSTAKDLLVPLPENMTIVTNFPVQRIIFKGKMAIGVESNGKQYLASKEVILSAGALDTPRVLMHSGIGPAKCLEEFNIPVVLDMPAVGQGLRDHVACPLMYTRTENSTSRKAFYGDKNTMDDALEQLKVECTGPFSKFACQMGIGWFKSDKLISSAEFQELPVDEKAFLLRETVPHYEIMTHFPMHWLIPGFRNEDLNYSCILVWYYNAQSRGEVTLQSSDPNVPLKFDPKFLAHPFDRRAAIEALREALRFTQYEDYAKDNVVELSAPKSHTDEGLLEHWRQTLVSTGHMAGTVKMGQLGGVDTVVDSDFRLVGIEGLRVADMSVVPILPSCHTQSVAYVTGMTCAEKLVAQYNLA